MQFKLKIPPKCYSGCILAFKTARVQRNKRVARCIFNRTAFKRDTASYNVVQQPKISGEKKKKKCT